MLPPPVALATAFAAAGAAAWCNRRVIGFLPDDPPGPGRKQHGRPTPLAGIVLAPAIAPWLVADGHWWTLAALVVAAMTGFVDDWRKERGSGLDWRTKALGLLAAAALGAAAICPPDRPVAFAAALVFVWILTNATNFLDNTNGVASALAATSLLIASGGTGSTGAIGWAALGFLPWNWPRARLFLGDSGAYLLGAATGIAVAGNTLVDLRGVLAAAVQIVDFVQVVIARLTLGLPPWVGDRRHLTHVAQNLGLPSAAVAPLFAVGAAAIAFAAA